MPEALTTEAAVLPPMPSPYRHLVFVYGTLKRGENDYPYWLADPCHAVFMGTARTCQRYPFFVSLLPDCSECSPNVLPMPVPCRSRGKCHNDCACALNNEMAAVTAHGDGISARWEAKVMHVEGELFAVTEAMKGWLDILEGVEGGTYAAITAEVEHVQPPRSLLRTVTVTIGSSTSQRQRQCSLYELLATPFLPTSASHGASGSEKRSNGVLIASLYARMKDFPSDWASKQPSSSSTFLRSFSAKSMLTAYGSRFAGGVPAHHRSSASAASLQRSLDALPEYLQPPMSTQNQRKRLLAASTTGNSEKEGTTWTDFYDAALDGALLSEAQEGNDDASLYIYGAPLLPKPLVLFIIDGIGDNTYPELGNRTPLEVVAGVSPRRCSGQGQALSTSGETPLPEMRHTLQLERFTPCPSAPPPSALLTHDEHAYLNEKINTITRVGLSGLMDPFLAGRSCGSDTAHLSFFGYNPEVYYRGRGAYESLGTAVDSSESDDEGFESESHAGLHCRNVTATATGTLTDEIADEAIRLEKGTNAESVKFVLGDEDVCFKSNFATFADPDEGGFGDEDGDLEARLAALSSEARGDASAATSNGQPFNTTKSYFVTHRRCDRDFTREGPVLCRYLNNMIIDKDVHGVPFEYPHVLKIKYATEHRCGVALSGAKVVDAADAEEGGNGASALKRARTESSSNGCGAKPATRVLGMLSDKISGTDCLKDGLMLRKCVPTITRESDAAEYERAVYTCRLVEAASEKITRFLKMHKINEQRRQHNRRIAAAGNSAVGGGHSGKCGARKNVANLILFRGAAKKGWVPTFDNRHGLRGAMVAPTCIIKGLGVCCGLECKTVCSVCFPPHIGRLLRQLRTHNQHQQQSDSEPLSLARVHRTNHALEGATGDYHSNLSVKVAAGLHALRLRCPTATHNASRVAAITAATAAGAGAGATVDLGRQDLLQHPHHNFLVIHVKGVDDAGHDANHHQKLRMIGLCGDALADLFTALPDGSTVALIADHSTPLTIGDHSCEPVPVSIAVKRCGAGDGQAGEKGVVGTRGRTLLEEVTSWRLWLRQQQPAPRDDPGAGNGVDEEARLSKATFSFSGNVFSSVEDLVLSWLEERAAASPLADGVQRYSEVEAARAQGLGRFLGDALIDTMKRMSTHYHHA